jgi:CheY-like chemotaxis protein
MSVTEWKNILLVDDNPVNLIIAKKVLKNIGVKVKTATNGQEALDCINKETFDAVLMDIQMPVMDGYQATQCIRFDAKHKDLPVIAMSANVMTIDVKKAFDAGMNAHLGKPLKVELLYETLLANVKLTNESHV